MRPEDGHVRQERADAVERALTRRLTTVNVVAAVAFILGGSLFALGAAFAQLGVGSLVTVNITYLVGGFFFSLGGYVSILLVVNAVRDERRRGTDEPMRWWGYHPHRRDWRSAVVLFTGTLFFAVSLVAAFAEGLTPRQSDGWIWLPDMIGCVCFLVSGRLAMLEVGDGHAGVRVHEVAWWVVAVNQLGSVLFFLAGIAAFTRPATSSAVDIGPGQLGHVRRRGLLRRGRGHAGFDKPTPTRTVVQPTS